MSMLIRRSCGAAQQASAIVARRKCRCGRHPSALLGRVDDCWRSQGSVSTPDAVFFGTERQRQERQRRGQDIDRRCGGEPLAGRGPRDGSTSRRSLFEMASHEHGEASSPAANVGGHQLMRGDVLPLGDELARQASEWVWRGSSTSVARIYWSGSVQRAMARNGFFSAPDPSQHISAFFFSTSSSTGVSSTSTSTSTSGAGTGTNGNSDVVKKRHPPPRSRSIGTTKVPTPPSAPPIQTNPLESLTSTTPKTVMRKGMELTVSVLKTVIVFILRLPFRTAYYLLHPAERRQRVAEIQKIARDELNHYWMGTKLLYGDVITARTLLGKTLGGSSLTRRERKQLLRTVSDMFRLVPFSMFVIIPFMEFALPFALRIFPNLLPSTFQDSLKAEESMKRELQTRIAMAQFFQETLEELAKEQKRKATTKKEELLLAGVDPGEVNEETVAEQEDSAASMLEFLETARKGEMIPPDVIIRYANYFRDDLTLDNMPRMQLINMCRYMSIPPYGSDSFLRFQLRHRVRMLKEDDQRILWEGIDSLTKMELREACQERGMRSMGLSKDAYKRNLQQWLDLSVNKNVPVSLLIMSRTFFLREEMYEPKPDDGTKSLAGLADAISGLDKEVLNEVILQVATSQEKKSDPDIQKIKLEVLRQQNELIVQEQAARDAAAAAAKKKAEASVEKDKGETTTTSGAITIEPQQAPASASDSIDATSVAVAEPHEADRAATVDGPPVGATDEAEERMSSSEAVEDEDGRNLSPDEMDAISQLVSDDPVSKERAELERIKAAMKAEEESFDERAEEAAVSVRGDEKVFTDELFDASVESATTSPLGDETERKGEDTESIDTRKDGATEQGAEAPGAWEEAPVDVDATEGTEEESAEDIDPVVARLKKRIESMVDKIEVQLSDVHVKIGDKLHFLDKDGDGILSREEMAQVLQQVLKREITSEEAMEIAAEVDSNHDGIFTVEELVKWIDEHKLVKFVEEGRDADMDRIIESHTVETQKDAPKEEPASSGGKAENS